MWIKFTSTRSSKDVSLLKHIFKWTGRLNDSSLQIRIIKSAIWSSNTLQMTIQFKKWKRKCENIACWKKKKKKTHDENMLYHMLPYILCLFCEGLLFLQTAHIQFISISQHSCQVTKSCLTEQQFYCTFLNRLIALFYLIRNRQYILHLNHWQCQRLIGSCVRFHAVFFVWYFFALKLFAFLDVINSKILALDYYLNHFDWFVFVWSVEK